MKYLKIKNKSGLVFRKTIYVLNKLLMNLKFVGLNSISPNVGLELWLSYLEYICRNNSDPTKIDKLFAQAIQQFGVENDSSSKVSRWYARLLTKRGDMLSARKIWNSIMSHQANKGEKVTFTM